MAVYTCRSCNQLKSQPRRYMFYFAKETRCPLCGTDKLGRLSRRDGIDRVYWNFFRLVHSLLTTRLYHCRFCRIQFYDVPRGDAPRAKQVA